MFKVTNKSTRHRSGVFMVNFEYIWHVVVVVFFVFFVFLGGGGAEGGGKVGVTYFEQINANKQTKQTKQTNKWNTLLP